MYSLITVLCALCLFFFCRKRLSSLFADFSFDWPMTLSDAHTKTIEITIKNEVGVFSKSRQFIGVVRIDLSQCDLTKAFTSWSVRVLADSC